MLSNNSLTEPPCKIFFTDIPQIGTFYKNVLYCQWKSTKQNVDRSAESKYKYVERQWPIQSLFTNTGTRGTSSHAASVWLTQRQLGGDGFHQRGRFSLTDLVLGGHAEYVVVVLKQLGHCDLSLVRRGVTDLWEDASLHVSHLNDIPHDRCPSVMSRLIPRQRHRVRADGSHSQVLRRWRLA